MVDAGVRLDDDDVACLCDALEAWENKDFAGQIMGDIFGMLLKDDNPAAAAKLALTKREQAEKYEREKRVRKERSIVLRAKLLQYRQARGIAEIEREVTR